MIRITVSIEEHEYFLAKTEARSMRISVAEFARRALQQALQPVGRRPWMRFAGLVETGDPRSSRSIDQTLYGTRSER